VSGETVGEIVSRTIESGETVGEIVAQMVEETADHARMHRHAAGRTRWVIEEVSPGGNGRVLYAYTRGRWTAQDTKRVARVMGPSGAFTRRLATPGDARCAHTENRKTEVTT
jgi:hypothetical protein